MSKHEEEPRIAVPLQEISLQEEVDNCIKQAEFCFTEGPRVFEDNDPERLSVEHLDPEKTILDCELLIKGELEDGKFLPFLTELITHVIPLTIFLKL